MIEYIFNGVGRPDVSTLGAIEVDEEARVIRILQVSDRLEGGRAKLIELMKMAGWTLAPEVG